MDDKRGTRLAHFEPRRATRRARPDVYPDRITVEFLERARPAVAELGLDAVCAVRIVDVDGGAGLELEDREGETLTVAMEDHAQARKARALIVKLISQVDPGVPREQPVDSGVEGSLAGSVLRRRGPRTTRPS